MIGIIYLSGAFPLIPFLMLDHWLPENISSFGFKIDAVMNHIWSIVFVWFVATEAVLFYFLLRYRKRRGGTAAYETGATWKALAWILIPSLFVLGFDLSIDLGQSKVWEEVKIDLPKNPDLVIRVEGQQFVWNFTLPGIDQKFGTADDIKTFNQLFVPLDATVVFELSSLDVLHSFWVPHMRLKQDAVPGRVIKGWFKAIKSGIYPIGCAELCGSGHGMMKGELHVLNAREYQEWLVQNSPKEGVAHE